MENYRIYILGTCELFLFVSTTDNRWRIDLIF